MKIPTLIFLLAQIAHASPRTSADYQITADISDSGGARATSADYTSDGSLSPIAGLSTAPDLVVKHGYIGQLYDLIGLTLSTDQNPREQEAAGQLSGFWQADDLSYGALAGNAVAWSVVDGPISAIDASGLMTGGIVLQDTAATVRGTYGAFTADLALTVLDTLTDNFGSYSGDGLDDAWQFQFFGLENPDAFPNADPDGDGQTNAFEFTAGLFPDDPTSRLRLEIASGLAPAEHRLTLQPRLPDRTYTIEFRANLSVGQWTPLGGAAFVDQGSVRTITDHHGVTAARYYRVKVAKP